MDENDIENRFSYHAPSSDEVRNTHEIIRNRLRVLAHSLNGALPECREKSLAITHLEEAMMWANAAVARHMN